MEKRNGSPLESAEQIALVRRCEREGVFLFGIPNGVSLGGSANDSVQIKARRYAEIAKLKAEGLTPGIPDLFVPAFRLFIEMKRRDGGVVGVKQKEVHAILRKLNYKVVVAYGAKEAWDAIQKEKAEF